MKHLYYYIEAGATLDSTTHVYMVSVGQDRQSQRDYLYLLAHSVDHNHYFSIKDGDSMNFVHRVMTTSDLPSSHFQSVSARQLVRHFKQKVAIPLDPAALKNHHHFADLMNGSYHFSNRLPKSANA